MSLQNHSYERCRSFVDSNFVKSPPVEKHQQLAVTLSRQKYSHAHEIGENLLELLDREAGPDEPHWAMFDRDLVHKILEDHNLPETVARYMPEDRDHDFSGIINEILGVHPSLWELFHHTCDTIVKLATVGNVILIGRGSHIISRHMPHVLHVRIIAPFEQRVERAAELLGISTHEAAHRVKHDDHAREAFVKSHFDESLDNPQAYHLTLNTGKMNPSAAASVIHSALKAHRFDKS
jgi:hypothetical protein